MENLWRSSGPDPLINEKMCEKIYELQDFDESVSHQFFEDINVTRITEMFENADERDILTVCYIAVRRFPVKYVTVLMDYLLEKEGR